MNAKLEVRQGVAGRGTFASEPIPRGAAFLEFVGPLLSYAQTTPHTLALQIAPDVYLGGSGGPDDCVNHSCEPNAGLRISFESPERFAVWLIAVRDIAAGEEIYFDYSTTMDEGDFEMKCACGRPGCRGVVRDFKHLPAALKRHYADLGVVPAYNLRYVTE